MRKKENRLLAGMMAALMMVTSIPAPAYAMEGVKDVESLTTEAHSQVSEEITVVADPLKEIISEEADTLEKADTLAKMNDLDEPVLGAEEDTSDTYTFSFNVIGTNKINVYISSQPCSESGTLGVSSNELNVVNGKATLEVKKEEVQGMYLAIGYCNIDWVTGHCQQGNITCKKGDSYFALNPNYYGEHKENDYYLFDLGKIEGDATFDFRYGFEESECQKVVINTKEDPESLGALSIVYSSNGFQDGKNEQTGNYTRGTMDVILNDDGQFVFWIPKGYDWAITKRYISGRDYESTFLLDQNGENILMPDQKIEFEEYYSDDYALRNDIEDGKLNVFHSFGKMPETGEETPLTYTLCQRGMPVITFQSDFLGSEALYFFTSIDGKEWSNTGVSEVVDGQGTVMIRGVYAGYKIAIVTVNEAAIYTTPLLFSKDGTNYDKPQEEIIIRPDTGKKTPAYIMEIPHDDQKIYVKTGQKTIHLIEDMPVGYSVEFLGGVENQIYDGKSDLTFKLSNVYGNELPSVELKYSPGGRWYNDDDGNPVWEPHCHRNSLEVWRTITPDEKGIYKIAKEDLAAWSDEIDKNLPLYFVPKVDCYDFDFRIAGKEIKSAEIVVGKTQIDVAHIDSADLSKCAIIKLDNLGDNSVGYRIPKQYYVGVKSIDSDIKGPVPAMGVVGADDVDGYPVEMVMNESIILIPANPDGSISIAVFDAHNLYFYRINTNTPRVNKIQYVLSMDGVHWETDENGEPFCAEKSGNLSGNLSINQLPIGVYVAIVGIDCPGYSVDRVSFDGMEIEETEFETGFEKWKGYNLGQLYKDGQLDFETSYILPMELILPSGYDFEFYEGCEKLSDGTYMMTGGTDLKFYFWKTDLSDLRIASVNINGVYTKYDQNGQLIEEARSDVYRLREQGSSYTFSHEIIKKIAETNTGYGGKFDKLEITITPKEDGVAYLTFDAEDVLGMDIVYSDSGLYQGYFPEIKGRIHAEPEMNGKFYVDIPEKTYAAIEKIELKDGKKLKRITYQEHELELYPEYAKDVVTVLGQAFDSEYKIECESDGTKPEQVLYTVIAFVGTHSTLKDLTSQLPTGYQWEDDTIKVASLGTTPKKIRIVKENGEFDHSYAYVIPYHVDVTIHNDATGDEIASKIGNGNSMVVVPNFAITGDTDALASAGYTVTTSIQATGNKVSVKKIDNGKYALTGIETGKDTIVAKYECAKNGTIIATYAKSYDIEVVDSSKKGLADIKVSLVTKDSENKDLPVAMTDGVYYVSASDKLYLKNDTAPYDSTGSVNDLKYTSSDSATAKIGKTTDAYTELHPVACGYVVITATASDTLASTKDIVMKVGPAKNDQNEAIYDDTNVLLNEYRVTLNTLNSDIAGNVEVITPSGEKVTDVASVNADGSANTDYAVSVNHNIVTIKGNKESKAGKIYLKVTLDDAKNSIVTIKNPVSVAVKAIAPKITIKQTAKLDTYYKDGSAELIISAPGEKIRTVTVNDDSKYTVTVDRKDIGKSSLSGKISLKDTTKAGEVKNTSVVVNVYLEGFDAPFVKTIKAGTVQSTAVLTVTDGVVYKGKESVLTTQLINKGTKSVVDLSGAEVSCNSQRYSVTVDAVNDVLKITPKTELAQGESEKIAVTVKAKEMQFAKTYDYTVTYADISFAALELKNKTLSLYKYDNDLHDTAQTVITLKGGVQSDILKNVLLIAGSNDQTKADYDMLKVATFYENGRLKLSATVTDNRIKAGSYKYQLMIPKFITGAEKEISTVLTVKVKDATGRKAPSVKVKLKGKLDSVNRAAGAVIIPTFKNVNTEDANVTAALSGRDAHLFEIGRDGKLYVSKGENVFTKQKYQIHVKYTVSRGDFALVCTSPAINITLSQAKPKAFITKPTAFSSAKADTKDVTVTLQNARGEQLNIEKIQVVNKNKAFEFAVDAGTGTVSITHNPMIGKTKKGKSYNVTLKVYPEGSADNEKPVTVTCPVRISK